MHMIFERVNGHTNGSNSFRDCGMFEASGTAEGRKTARETLDAVEGRSLTAYQ